MKLKSILIFIGILVFCSGSLAASAQAPKTETIGQLRHKQLRADSLHKVSGYISFQYRCPPCPDGALCKACMEDNIVLSETQQRLTNYSGLGDSSIIIYTKGSVEVKFDKVVVATIRVRKGAKASRGLDNLELISLDYDD
jgi:hypothetical protein